MIVIVIATVNSRVKSTKRQTQTSDKEKRERDRKREASEAKACIGLRGKQKPNELVPRAGNTTSGGSRVTVMGSPTLLLFSDSSSATLIKAKWPLLELQL